MGKKEPVYTLMVVPHANNPTLSWQFPLRWVRIIGLALATLACFSLILSFNYQQAKIAAKEFKQLATEFQEQQLQFLVIAKQAEELEKDMATIRDLDDKVRTMMHLTPKSASLDNVASEPEGVAERLPVASRGGLATTILRTQLGLQATRESLPAGEGALQGLTKDIALQQARDKATPSIWPTNGRITSNYGYRRSPFGYGSQFHAGIDIGARRGTPIYATADGKVEFAGYKSGYGYMVQIYHGYSHSTLYAHMSKLGTRSGKNVSKGELIGYVGSSGWSTGPHLHYEVRINGKTVNPRPYMNR